MVIKAVTYFAPSSKAIYLGRLKDGMSSRIPIINLTREVRRKLTIASGVVEIATWLSWAPFSMPGWGSREGRVGTPRWSDRNGAVFLRCRITSSSSCVPSSSQRSGGSKNVVHTLKP